MRDFITAHILVLIDFYISIDTKDSPTFYICPCSFAFDIYFILFFYNPNQNYFINLKNKYPNQTKKKKKQAEFFINQTLTKSGNLTESLSWKR